MRLEALLERRVPPGDGDLGGAQRLSQHAAQSALDPNGAAAAAAAAAAGVEALQGCGVEPQAMQPDAEVLAPRLPPTTVRKAC